VPYKDPEKRREVWRKAQQKRRDAGMVPRPTTEQNRLYNARANGKRSGSHRFVGVDGEGWTDKTGQHHYMALVVGDRVLYKGRPLTTRECLDFLLEFPDRPGVYYVGFFFDYDVTMILRDILRESPGIMQEIINPRGDNYRKTVRWGKYKISYIPRKRLTIRKYGDDLSRVVIHDTRSFFQMSFVKALKTYGLDERFPDEFAKIEIMKRWRSGFDLDRAKEIISYCKMECQLLAELMGVVRNRFAHARLDASPYEGPGPVAGKVLKAHGFKDSEDLLSHEIREWSRKAYYGGRFEIAAHGTIPGQTVYEYDIKSAYPWAMTQLPCLLHGVWSWEEQRTFANQIDGLWCGFMSWDLRTTSDDNPGGFGPLPFRLPDGRIHFPLAGSGWYWSVEAPGYAWVTGQVLRYHKTCNCKPFAWVEEMFKERLAMEADRKGSGIALKLVLNSLYGKLAQRVGSRPYFNSVWSGLITAMTRARVRTIMFATDAVFTLDPITDLIDLGDGLGSWEHAGTYSELTIFQPGVYFDEGAAKFKTRGVPVREIQERAPEFIAAANTPDGEVTMQMSNHLGLRQCIAWGPTRYKDLGNWIDAPRTMRVDPTLKRRLIGGQWTIDGHGTRWSHPIPGDPSNITTPYEADPDDEPDRATNMWEEGLHDAEDDGEWLENPVTTKRNTSGENNGHNNATG
jgi:hypothetical protein